MVSRSCALAEHISVLLKQSYSNPVWQSSHSHWPDSRKHQFWHWVCRISQKGNQISSCSWRTWALHPRYFTSLFSWRRSKKFELELDLLTSSATVASSVNTGQCPDKIISGMHSHVTDLSWTVRMEKRGCNFDRLNCEEDLHNEEHPPYPDSNQDTKPGIVSYHNTIQFLALWYWLIVSLSCLVSAYSMTSWSHSRLAAVSLALLAAVLLIVNIGLGVHCKSNVAHLNDWLGLQLRIIFIIK